MSFDLNSFASQVIATLQAQKRHAPLTNSAVDWLKLFLVAGALLGIINQLMFGAGYGIVRLNHDMSAWMEWIRNNMPEAREILTGVTTYFEFPVIPAMGPTPLLVAAYDSRTIILALSKNTLLELVDKNKMTNRQQSDGKCARSAGFCVARCARGSQFRAKSGLPSLEFRTRTLACRGSRASTGDELDDVARSALGGTAAKRPQSRAYQLPFA